jgi:hypothetical protein
MLAYEYMKKCIFKIVALNSKYYVYSSNQYTDKKPNSYLSENKLRLYYKDQQISPA